MKNSEFIKFAGHTLRLAEWAANQVRPVAETHLMVVEHSRRTDVEEPGIVLAAEVHGTVTRGAGVAFTIAGRCDGGY